ncbi:MAG: hypothetical protein L3J05_05995 [Robiginitomaculum sp.]|nr:hypothetical protein [Robiginitomaculum sp.]
MKKLILKTAATMLCILAPLPMVSQLAFADPYEDAVEAMARKDYSAAYNLLSPLANSGNDEAQFEIALLYLNGNYGAKSERKSTGVMWLRRSADGGNLVAQKEMSILWDLGSAYGVSYEESKKYRRMAAEQGDASRQYSVGLSYSHEKNYTKARYWYEKASAQGHAVAAEALKALPAAPLVGFSIYDRSPTSTNPLTAAQIKKAEDEGYAAYKIGNYAQSLKLWAPAAQAGSGYAQSNLGIQYINAQGTERSKEKALYWLEKAMAQDYELAFRIVAELHNKGIFFPKSDQKAYEYSKKSSDLGSAQGAFAAAEYVEGLGDLKGAIALYTLGAERGHPRSQATLGIIYDGVKSEYRDNNIVTIDLEKSMHWHLKAAQQDFPFSVYQVGFNYSTGTGVPKSLALAQYWHKRGARDEEGMSMMSLSAADQEDIRKELLQSAKTKAQKGDAEAQYTLSVAYRDGKDVQQSTALSEHWLVKAAGQSMPEAMVDLAEIYDDGQGSPHNAEKSKALYMKLATKRQEPAAVVTRAIREFYDGDSKLAFALAKPYADDGNKYAQNIIGKMYSYGRGVPVSNDKALTYFKMASEAGLADAQENLGFLYELSFNNPVEAAKWYRKAANQNHIEGLKSLAGLYSSGNGVPKNQTKAIELYGRAAAAGDEMAEIYKSIAQGEQRMEQQAYARTQAERQVLAAERKKIEAQEQKRRAKQPRQTVQTRTYTFPAPKVNKWSLAYLFTPRPQSGSGYSYSSSSSYSGSNSNYNRGYYTTIDSGAATRSVYAVAPPPRRWVSTK